MANIINPTIFVYAAKHVLNFVLETEIGHDIRRRKEAGKLWEWCFDLHAFVFLLHHLLFAELSPSLRDPQFVLFTCLFGCLLFFLPIQVAEWLLRELFHLEVLSFDLSILEITAASIRILLYINNTS